MPRAAGAAPIRVLIAEDDTILRELYTDFFREDEWFSVRVAPDGSEALRLFADGGADVLVTDLCMPRTGGEALVRHLRDGGSDIPVIAVTGFPERLDGWTRRDLGIRSWLPKPMLLPRLRQTILAVASAA